MIVGTHTFVNILWLKCHFDGAGKLLIDYQPKKDSIFNTLSVMTCRRFQFILLAALITSITAAYISENNLFSVIFNHPLGQKKDLTTKKTRWLHQIFWRSLLYLHTIDSRFNEVTQFFKCPTFFFRFLLCCCPIESENWTRVQTAVHTIDTGSAQKNATWNLPYIMFRSFCTVSTNFFTVFWHLLNLIIMTMLQKTVK